MPQSPGEPTESIETPTAVSGRLIWPILKWSLCIAVLLFVGKRAYELWNQDELQQLDIHVGWLIVAALVYVIGWLPSVWFWWRLMQSLGGTVGFRDAARAYYCGHLGKYVPGKAIVIVIRSAMVKERGSSATAAALTAAYETLLMMGAGLAVAVGLSPVTGWPRAIAALELSPLLAVVGIVAAVLLLLPVLSWLLTRVAGFMMPSELTVAGRPARIATKLVAQGLLAFVASWAALGLSLGLTLQAVSSAPMSLADWPIWTGCVSMATAIGFLMIFAPGGVGVREILLIEALQSQPGIGEKQAVAAAILLRLVWLLAEIAAAAALYYIGKRKQSFPAASSETNG